MRPVEPAGESGGRIMLGQGQQEYEPLPARFTLDAERRMVTHWEPTVEELASIMAGGRIRLTVLTFGHSFLPVILDVVPPPELEVAAANGG